MQAVVQVLAVWQVLTLGKDLLNVSFLSGNKSENENIQLSKNQRALSVCSVFDVELGSLQFEMMSNRGNQDLLLVLITFDHAEKLLNPKRQIQTS